MKYLFPIIFCFFLISCSTNNKVEKSQLQNLKIVKIEEFKTFYKFNSIDYKNDTLNVISFKNVTKQKSNFYETLKIAEQNTYGFKLENIKTRVSTMQQLGQFIIIEKDTLWKGSSDKVAPKYSVSKNTVGLQIFN
jgi:hypothetical protein